MSKYKPTNQTSDYSDSELLEKLIETAKKLAKNSFTMDEFEESSGLSRGPYKRKWGWNVALKKAGLIPSVEKNVDNEQILSDMKRVFDILGRTPTKAEYNQFSNFSSAILQRRFGGLKKAYHQLNIYIDKNGEASLPPISILQSEGKRGIRLVSKTKIKPVGAPINFRGMLHAPLNENGVIFLFGLVCKDLGFIIDSISPGFPDCIAKRKMTNSDAYIPVFVEFEYKSKRFLEHKHNREQCDIIVCWEHNWPKCPEDIEVIALREEIKRLPHS